MKKRFFSLLVAALLVISTVPLLYADETGGSIGMNIGTEEFPVIIEQCGEWVFLEDCVEEGRGTDCADNLVERLNNYAFEGEQVETLVVVMDKNKIEEVEEVVGTLGPTQGEGNDIEVECQEVDFHTVDRMEGIGDGDGTIPDVCQLRIGQENFDHEEFDRNTQAFYKCTFTVETPDSMQGEFFYTVEAISADSSDTLDENIFWFLNPIIALSIDGDLEFDNVRPGSLAYSSTLLVGNDAEEGSGVLLDMFISGTDFYDPDNSGARCPDTNQLKLSNNARSPANIVADGGSEVGSADAHGGAHARLACEAGTEGITDSSNADHLCYSAVNGAYSTAGASNADVEGYVPIVYGEAFSRDFYNDAEIIRNPGLDESGLLDINGVPYHAGNVVSPGSEVSVTFKLGLPEPCVGNFNEGAIWFWGEAV